MRIDKKKASTLFALTLLITSLLLVNMNVPVKAQVGPSSKYLHEEGGLTTLHLDAKAGLINLNSPLLTYWHELYPQFCRGDYRLTSWNDTDHDEMLDWCDQIDMFYLPMEKTYDYHVERVMVTLNLTRSPDGYRIYVEYNGTLPIYDQIHSPVCTKWHEVYPVWCYMYHIVGIPLDTPPTGLSYCDMITLVNMSSGVPATWHVEKVSTDMIVTQKNTEPVSTQWHELYPRYSNRYNLTGWKDNGDKVLSPCDNVSLTDKVTHESALYHVDEVTVTLNLTLLDSTYWIMIEFEGGYPQFWYPITHPICTRWHEVYPQFCPYFHLNSWYDNGDGILSKCDTIDMINETSGSIQYWHVEQVSKDIVVTPIVGPPPPPTTPPMYWKPGYPDYAPSGVPDFYERQDLFNGTGMWTWCVPTAVADSLWWMDSRFDSDPKGSKLLTNYTAGIDDHDPRNVQPFIRHLAYLMDTDGLRTGIIHAGTKVSDMQAGIAQYLSWAGNGTINPPGDVNGDGIVNMTDWNIVNVAMGSFVVGGVPIGPWNMAADIWPVSTGWPARGMADNVVNASDLALVTANMNKTGMFYEKTVRTPDFTFVETEVERCEDVILLLDFYDANWHKTTGLKELGHAVTVAGVNSTSMPPRIAISDPDMDNAEPAPHGTGGPGKVLPEGVPHVHNATPPDTLHNNASYVSHDIYNVTFIPPPPPPRPTNASWALDKYSAPPWIWAVVEWAVIVSPLAPPAVCGVDITNVVNFHCGSPRNSGYPGWTIQVNVTIHNNGTIPLNCTVKAYYYNATTTIQIGAPQNIINLAPSNTITLTFNWNLLGLPVCKSYTVKANATCICGASDEFVNGLMKIKLVGDVDGSNAVDWVDLGLLGLAYGSAKGTLNWNPDADFDGSGAVDWVDLGLLGLNYGISC